MTFRVSRASLGFPCEQVRDSPLLTAEIHPCVFGSCMAPVLYAHILNTFRRSKSFLSSLSFPVRNGKGYNIYGETSCARHHRTLSSYVRARLQICVQPPSRDNIISFLSCLETQKNAAKYRKQQGQRGNRGKNRSSKMSIASLNVALSQNIFPSLNFLT